MSADRISLPTLATQLLHDAVAVARAEIALAKAKLTTRVAAAKSAAILLVAAAIVALLGLIALVVGSVMALATLIGPGLAGLAVFLVLIAIAGILGWLGAKQLSTKPVAVAEMVP